jgi:hypothetical protein
MCVWNVRDSVVLALYFIAEPAVVEQPQERKSIDLTLMFLPRHSKDALLSHKKDRLPAGATPTRDPSRRSTQSPACPTALSGEEEKKHAVSE